MKVLHVQKAVGLAGSERHLLMLLPALAAKGFDVRMCVLAAGEYRRFVDALERADVDVAVIPISVDVSPLVVARLRRQIARFRADLVHTHLVHGDLYGSLAARLTGVPHISSQHATHAFLGRMPYRVLARAAGRDASRVVAISDHVARFVTDLALARKGAVSVVPYGIEPGLWERTAEQRERTRSALGITARTVAIGVASRLWPNKGHDRLIGAVADLQHRYPEVSLLVAGDGPLRRELERQARESLGEATFRFLGHIDDVASFMAACDVMVFPTQPGFGEGFGLAALEAMAAGRPLVASRLDSLPEIVQDRVTGILVDPRDKEDLARALSELVTDAERRHLMGIAGRRRAVEHFSLTRMVDATARIYKEVTGAYVRD